MKQRRSLRLYVLILVSFFSIVPLVTVATFALFQLDSTLRGRLRSDLETKRKRAFDELTVLQRQLYDSTVKLSRDPQIPFAVATRGVENLKTLIDRKSSQIFSEELTIFSSSGRALMLRKGKKITSGGGAEILDQKRLQDIATKRYTSNADFKVKGKRSTLSIVSSAAIESSSGSFVGVIQEKISLNLYLDSLKKVVGADYIVADPKGRILSATQRALNSLEGQTIVGLSGGQSHFHKLNGKNFLVAADSLEFNDKRLLLLTFDDVTETVLRIQQFQRSLFLIILILLLLIIGLTFWTGYIFVKPLENLVSAANRFRETGTPVKVVTNNQTEIGALVQSFNELSFHVFQVQEELRLKLAQLEGANAQIKETQSQLIQSAKMASLGQLVAGVAHELNNPIGFIFANMVHLKEYSDSLFQLLDKFQKDSKYSEEFEAVDYDFIRQDLPKLISSCQDGAQRTKDIVLGLRNFSRLDEAEKKEININESVQTTLDLLKAEIKGRIKVTTHFSELPLIEVYASQINQVLMNILSNACQAIEGKGTIEVRTRSNASEIVIEIKDSGIGMTDEQIAKIFDPFYTTKPIGQGTGLGLSISHGIVEKHGGSISVESKPTKGTTFKVKLPRFR